VLLEAVEERIRGASLRPARPLIPWRKIGFVLLK